MKICRMIALMAATALLSVSCMDGDVRMFTVVNSDGSCVREVSCDADSSVLVGNVAGVEEYTPLRLDSCWRLSWGVKDGDERNRFPMSVEEYSACVKRMRAGGYERLMDDTLRLYATRSFSSVAEMSDALPMSVDRHKVNANYSLEKKFRWFYTDYTYTERYECLGVLFPLPVTNFLSKEVALYWFTGKPELMQGMTPAEAKDRLDNIEEAIGKWLAASLFCCTYDMITDHYADVEDAPVSKVRFVVLKDSAMRYALDNGYEVGVDRGAEVFKGFFKSDAYSKFFESGTKYHADLDRRVKLYLDILAMDINSTLAMPGKIIATENCISTDGVVNYKLTGCRLIPEDYVVAATSRVVNVWAFLLCALLLAAAYFGTYYLRRKR